MFEVGDYIVYGNQGVCRVEGIGPMHMGGIKTDRLYYTLLPVYISGSTVYTPVDNTKVILRQIISKEEAMQLLEEIPQLEQIDVTDEKGREQIYKDALASCDCKELVRIIKTLYLRRQSRLEDGKKVTALDERYFRMAEDALYGELAIALGLARNGVEEYITRYLEQHRN